MGCSFIPSPAFITDALTSGAIRCGAPDIEWRITSISVPIALIVAAVSISVSPFWTLEPLAVMFAAFALIYLAASSNERRVLVLFS